MSLRRTLLIATAIVFGLIVAVDLLNLDPEKYDVLSILGLILAVAGFLKEPKDTTKSVQATEARASDVAARFPKLKTKLDGGLFGGLAGGCLAGVIIGGAYHVLDSGGSPFPGLIPEIVVASAVTGPILGVLCQLLAGLFAYFRQERRLPALVFNEFTGGLLGGLSTGVLVGMPFGWHFGRQPVPLIGEDTLLIGALPGAIVILLVIIVYDAGTLSFGMARNFVVAIVMGVITALAGLAINDTLELYSTIENYLYRPASTVDLMIGGCFLGLFVGAILGCVIGTSLLLDRIWRPAVPA